MGILQIQENFNDIFRYQVENNGLRSKISRATFWNEIFCHRINDTEIYKIFLNSECPLLFISGMVGTGKSTFIRAMFEKEKFCTGIIIDFTAHAAKFINDDEIVIESQIHQIIRESLYNLLIENIKYKIILSKQNYSNLHYDPNIEVININKELWRDPFTIHKAKTELFILAIKHLFLEPSISNFLYRQDMIPSIKHSEFVEELENKFKSNKSLLSEFDLLLNWKLLLNLLRCLSGDNLSFILCFDNIDAIKFSNIQSHFLDAIINISNDANNTLSDGVISTLNPPPIKIVLNVRDENISRLNLSGSGTKRYMQIMLGRDCKALNSATETYIINQPKDFFYNIVNKRLKVINEYYLNEVDINLIINLIKSQFINTQYVEGVNDEYINLFELSNESIRMMLDLISELAFKIYDVVLKNEIPGNAVKYANELITGKLIHFMFQFDTTKDVILKIAESLRNEHNFEKFCCSYRLCLTYIYNCYNKEVAFVDLKNDFYNHLGIEEARIKRTIFKLYNTGSRESEIITIYQNEMINEGSDIKDEAIIKLNSKGINILMQIIKHIDFYGYAVDMNSKTGNKCLFEMTPEEGLNYIKLIYSFIEKTYTSHKYFLVDLIFPTLQKKYRENTFSLYEKTYCIGKTFHLTRVCSNQINQLKKYIIEILRGEECSLIIENSRRTNLKRYLEIDIQESRLLTDHELNFLLNNCKVDQEVIELYQYQKKYEIIQREMTVLYTRLRKQYSN